MIEKKHRYSNVELLDIIKNSHNKIEIKKSKDILDSRKLTPKQKSDMESDYLKHKELQEKRKNEPLTTEEWLSFFILPSFTPKLEERDDHFTESESERFKKYGYEKKAQQSEKVKMFGIIFWLFIIVVVGITFKYLNR